MITVKPKLLRTSSDIKDAGKTILNGTVKALADSIQNEVGSLKCDNHPTRNSVLRVIAKPRTKIEFDKSGFCCKEFADRVTIKR